MTADGMNELCEHPPSNHFFFFPPQECGLESDNTRQALLVQSSQSRARVQFAPEAAPASRCASVSLQPLTNPEPILSMLKPLPALNHRYSHLPLNWSAPGYSQPFGPDMYSLESAFRVCHSLGHSLSHSLSLSLPPSSVPCIHSPNSF